MSHLKMAIAEVPILAFIFLLAAIGLAGLTAYDDVRYLIYSKTIDADLISTTPKGAGDKRTTVKYSFTDGAEGIRTEEDTPPFNWTVPKGPKVSVAYIPGVKRASHLTGNWNGYWLYLLGIFAVLGAFIGFQMLSTERKRAARAERQRLRGGSIVETNQDSAEK
jgi:hypothetical protein